MKLKMSPNSLFAILLRSPWWISFCVVAVITLASRALLPEGYVAFGVIGAFPFVVIGVMAAWRQRYAPDPARLAETLQRAGAMPWREFSVAVEKGFSAQAYTVTRWPGTAADFKLEKNGHTTLVSCKRWKAVNQGVEALRELVACQQAQGAGHSVFISLNPLTATAQKFAKAHGIVLMSDTVLTQLLG